MQTRALIEGSTGDKLDVRRLAYVRIKPSPFESTRHLLATSTANHEARPDR
jgi:hypothetical protein